MEDSPLHPDVNTSLLGYRLSLRQLAHPHSRKETP